MPSGAGGRDEIPIGSDDPDDEGAATVVKETPSQPKLPNLVAPPLAPPPARPRPPPPSRGAVRSAEPTFAAPSRGTAPPEGDFDADLRSRYPEIDAAVESIGKQELADIDAALDSLEKPPARLLASMPPQVPSAVPQAAVPQAAMPQSTVPQNAMPQNAMPQGAVPQAAMPPGMMPPGMMPPGMMPPGAPPGWPAWGPWGWGPPPPGWVPPAGWGPPPMPAPGAPQAPQGPSLAEQLPPLHAAAHAAAMPAPVPAPAVAPVLVSLRGVGRTFERGSEKLSILSGLDLEVRRGSFEALMGPSGSGKSTLLNLIAGLDRPTTGSVEIGGVRLNDLSGSKLARWRADNIGFIFQQFNLIPVFTAFDNVMLPLRLTSLSGREQKKRAQTALRILGLEDRMHHYPRELSGGQEQRVAIARAIVNDPALLIADEPTGDLDRKSADDVLVLLDRLATEFGKTIIMVTHDPVAAERARVVHRLDKGVIVH